ncbi:(2E,6E)-farnesyl diphosphate synthase [Glaciecola sp. MF2-115]|uniref:(2E,6E)-farnesyl diphosphate synthase n=1 Tax=Glaciecola sp. MF2-115 TaxID=3384827 RepID=UPI00399F3097
MSFSSIQQNVQARIDQKLTQFIEQQTQTANELVAAMKYSAVGGGKRMRPLLLSIVGEMLGADQDDLDVASMAIECIHAYSLIHDDLPAMDDDALRRGKPTNHIQYGEATAILAGDALQTLAFEIVLNHPLSAPNDAKRIDLARVIAKASGVNGMCAGQSIDLIATGNDISLEQLTQLHQLKTGALLSACVSLGSILAPRITDEETELLQRYAKKVGLAFQVQDDILDVISDSETLGKPQGSDFELNKNTFVSHLGLEGSQSFLQKLHHEALQAISSLPYDTEQLKAFTDYLVSRKY